MPAITVDKAALKAFGRAVRGIDKDLRRELIKAVKQATKPARDEIQTEARKTLPSSGGLGVWVAGIDLRTQQTYTGGRVEIEIRPTLDNKRPVRGGGKGRRARRNFGARADLAAINRGRVMHPTFGRGPLVGPQSVRPGFWDRPLEGPVARRAEKLIRQAMEDAARAVASAAGRST